MARAWCQAHSEQPNWAITFTWSPATLGLKNLASEKETGLDRNSLATVHSRP